MTKTYADVCLERASIARQDVPELARRLNRALDIIYKMADLLDMETGVIQNHYRNEAQKLERMPEEM